MKYYRAYMDRQEMSAEGRRALLDMGGPGREGRTARKRGARRWGALVACCALVAGLGLWALAQSGQPGDRITADALYPGIQDAYGPGEEPGDGALAEGPDGDKWMLPNVPAIYYQEVDGALAADGALPRELTEGSFSVELTWEEIQTIFWGPEGEDHPEHDPGDLPWMLFWEGYDLTGSALYDSGGSLLWLNLWGEGRGGAFTLTLRPGALPFQCGLYASLETSDVMGVPVTGWSREADGLSICCSEFMAGDVGVRFENSGGPFGSEYGESGSLSRGGVQIFNALLVRQALSADGGLYLGHLLAAEEVPEWRAREYDSLEEALAEEDFIPYVPQSAPAGWGDFSGRLTYQEGNEHTLSLRWSRGYGDLSIQVCLPEGDTVWGGVADVDSPESYDVRLYQIPWADSVPEEVRDTFYAPVFRAEDMSRAVVEARAYPVDDQGDVGGPRMDFSVLHGDGALVAYWSKGLSVDEMWALVEPTLTNG